MIPATLPRPDFNIHWDIPTSISPEDVAASRAKPLHAATQDFAPSCFRSASEMFERKKPPRRAAHKRLIWRVNLVAGVGFEPTTFRL